MFKKVLFIASLLFVASKANAAFDVRTSACSSMAIGFVNVSTITPTALRVGSSELAGRTMFSMVNTESNLAVFVGTHSAVTVANGYRVYGSSLTANTISWPVGANITLYGIGTAGTAGPANVRVLECAQ